MEMVKEAVSTDPTKDLIAFMREEMEKSRQHEMTLQATITPSKARLHLTTWHIMKQDFTQHGMRDLHQTKQISQVCQRVLYGTPFPYDSGKYTPL